MTYENFFFHVGMCKTGTTFVQSELFPQWPNIQYLHHRNLEYFINLRPDQSYLISCEGFTGRMFGDIQEKRCSLVRLAEMFPRARCIISVRRHDGYLASLYSQYLRYGGSGEFHDFIDLENATSQAFVQQEDFCFEPVIRQAEESFEAPPFVFENAELRNNLDGLLKDLAAFLGTNIPKPNISGKRHNTGLGKYQGELLRRINSMARIQASRTGRYRPYSRTRRLRIDPPRLFGSYLGWISTGPLLHPNIKEEINTVYQDDWKYVQKFLQRCPWRKNLGLEV